VAQYQIAQTDDDLDRTLALMPAAPAEAVSAEVRATIAAELMIWASPCSRSACASCPDRSRKRRGKAEDREFRADGHVQPNLVQRN